MKRLGISLFFAFLACALAPASFVFSSDEHAHHDHDHHHHEIDGVGGPKEEIESINEEIKERKNKVQELEKTIAEYKKKIEKKRTEAVSLSNQVAILDNRIVQVEVDLELTEEKIATLELEIEQLETIITQKQNSIDKQKKILAEFLRTLHHQGQESFVEIIAAHESFSSFYNRIQYLKTVEQDMNQSTQALKIGKAELEGKRDQTKLVQASYEALQEDLEAKREDLDDQVFLKANLLAETQSSELTFKTLVNNLRQQYRDLESEISAREQAVRQKLEEADKLSQISDSLLESSGEFILSWPSQSRYITSRYHDPDYPYRHVFEHSGMDIRAAQATPLKATASGYVARARKCSVASCYAYVMIVHSGGYSTVYGHMSRIDVAEDQFVTRGDVIGLSGGTPGTVGAGPFVTGPHLHFELRKDGIPINPLPFMVKDY